MIKKLYIGLIVLLVVLVMWSVYIRTGDNSYTIKKVEIRLERNHLKRLTVDSKQTCTALAQAIQKASMCVWTAPENNNPELCVLRLYLHDGTVENLYYDPHTGIAWKQGGEGERLHSDQLNYLLGGLWHQLRQQVCGEAISWPEVNKLLPRYSQFKIEDFETSLSFEVQRRGGTFHADVQPLTRADTATLKLVYGGKWSWERRAVRVYVNDRVIAGSINGMPHGAGSLINGFPGHFCLHTQGSRVHQSGKEDLGHLLMIKKASGQLGKHLLQATPLEVVEAFASLVTQGDYNSANCCLVKEGATDYRVLKSVNKIEVLEAAVVEERDGMCVVEAKFSVVPYTTWRDVKFEASPVLYWLENQGWKLYPASLIPQIQTALQEFGEGIAK